MPGKWACLLQARMLVAFQKLLPKKQGVGTGVKIPCAVQELSNVVPGAKWGLEMRGNEHKSQAPGRGARPAGARSAMNEVVCGAMMLAYERAGKWDEVLLRTCPESPLSKFRGRTGFLPGTLITLHHPPCRSTYLRLGALYHAGVGIDLH